MPRLTLSGRLLLSGRLHQAARYVTLGYGLEGAIARACRYRISARMSVHDVLEDMGMPYAGVDWSGNARGIEAAHAVMLLLLASEVARCGW